VKTFFYKCSNSGKMNPLLSRKISQEKSLDFLSQQSVVRLGVSLYHITLAVSTAFGLMSRLLEASRRAQPSAQTVSTLDLMAGIVHIYK